MTAQARCLLEADRAANGERSGFRLAALRTTFARAGWHYTTAGRCAARYALLVGCSQREAAKAFGVSDSTVSFALQKVRA